MQNNGLCYEEKSIQKNCERVFEVKWNQRNISPTFQRKRKGFYFIILGPYTFFCFEMSKELDPKNDFRKR